MLCCFCLDLVERISQFKYTLLGHLQFRSQLVDLNLVVCAHLGLYLVLSSLPLSSVVGCMPSLSFPLLVLEGGDFQGCKLTLPCGIQRGLDTKWLESPLPWGALPDRF